MPVPRWALLLVSAACLCAGCQSPREKALAKQREFHRAIRESRDAPPGEWRLKTEDD